MFLLLVVAAAAAVAVELAAAFLMLELYAVGWRIGAGVYNKAAREENVKKRDLLKRGK